MLVDEPLSTVVSRVPDGAALVLSGTAEAIWHRVPRHEEPPITVAQLVADLAAEAGLPPESIEGDVHAFLGELRSARLLVEEHT